MSNKIYSALLLSSTLGLVTPAFAADTINNPGGDSGGNLPAAECLEASKADNCVDTSGHAYGAGKRNINSSGHGTLPKPANAMDNGSTIAPIGAGGDSSTGNGSGNSMGGTGSGSTGSGSGSSMGSGSGNSTGTGTGGSMGGGAAGGS